MNGNGIIDLVCARKTARHTTLKVTIDTYPKDDRAILELLKDELALIEQGGYGRSGIGCLPVVDDNQLVGIVTSYDFLTATASLFKQHLAASATASDKEAAVHGASA